MNDVEQALIAFSKQEISGHAVFRVMAESKDWYVPALFATDVLKTNMMDRTVMLSVEFQANPRQLVLFTSAEAAHRAAGRPFGLVGGPFSGLDIFSALDENQFAELTVNPGSPREETFYVEAGAFSVLRLIADTIRLEQALLRSSDTYVPFAELKAHPGYLVAVSKPEMQVLSLELKDMPGRYAVIFTAPDRVEHYTKALGTEPATVALAGDVLFQQLQGMSFAGVILNVGSPKYFVLPASFFPHIVAAS